MTDRTRRAPGAEALLATVLAGVPRLTDPACRGQAWLFDPADPAEDRAEAEYRHHRALALCRTCPALTACSTWISTLPATKRPAGVIAGQPPTTRPAPGRPRKETA